MKKLLRFPRSVMGNIVSAARFTTDEVEITYRLAWLTMRWYYLAKRGVFRLYGDEQ